MIKKIQKNIWEIPKKGKMNVSGRIYASEKLMQAIKQDKTLEQVKNVAQLPGILKHSLAMPDAHQGYGFSIGGVAAFDMEEGIISPGGVGYDINCSVRLVQTNIPVNEFLKKREEITKEIYKNVPSGVGSDGKIKLTHEELDEVLAKGIKWAIEKGYATKDDANKIEEKGCMKSNPEYISPKAKKRGKTQLGSLGAGNHFIEFQKTDKILEKNVFKKFKLNSDNVCLMIHCGSRGLGHQVASDYIKKMEEKYGFKNLPDRELINAPIKSELGKQYYSAMSGAANFGFTNKQLITHWIRESFDNVFGKSKLNLIYDICHNIAKYEEHKIDGKKQQVCIHRKGATRSFGKGRKELPDIYRDVGQPVIIPGSMGTASYVLVGTKEAEKISFGSTAHGAGRLMSRSAAFKNLTAEKVNKNLKEKNIHLCCHSEKGVVSEAPEVYKDIDEVIKVSKELKLGIPVSRVVPLSVIKG